MTTTPQTPPAEPELQSITAQRAIALCRRWLIVSALFYLAMAGATAIAVTWSLNAGGSAADAAPIALAVLVGSVVIAAMGVRSRRLVIDAVPLIAAGAYDAAEDRLSRSLASFSVLRSTKLLGLQQLAVLRLAQARWAEAAGLSRELLARQRGRRERQLEVPTRLVLAESLVELGDVDGASREIAALSGARIDLRGTLMLTLFRLELAMRRDDPGPMLAGYATTLPMIELLPPPLAARAHALLAWGAWRLRQVERHTFLVRRVRLLGSVDALIKERPQLGDALIA